MLRVPVNKIEPGMVLARPVPMPNDPYRFLLQRDREIPVTVIPRLKQMGILEVWVRCRDLEFLEDVIDEGLGDRQREVYHHVRRNFESILDGAAGSLFLVFVEEISIPICKSVIKLWDILSNRFWAEQPGSFLTEGGKKCYLLFWIAITLSR